MGDEENELCSQPANERRMLEHERLKELYLHQFHAELADDSGDAELLIEVATQAHALAKALRRHHHAGQTAAVAASSRPCSRSSCYSPPKSPASLATAGRCGSAAAAVDGGGRPGSSNSSSRPGSSLAGGSKQLTSPPGCQPDGPAGAPAASAVCGSSRAPGHQTQLTATPADQRAAAPRVGADTGSQNDLAAAAAAEGTEIAGWLQWQEAASSSQGLAARAAGALMPCSAQEAMAWQGQQQQRWPSGSDDESVHDDSSEQQQCMRTQTWTAAAARRLRLLRGALRLQPQTDTPIGPADTAAQPQLLGSAAENVQLAGGPGQHQLADIDQQPAVETAAGRTSNCSWQSSGSTSKLRPTWAALRSVPWLSKIIGSAAISSAARDPLSAAGAAEPPAWPLVDSQLGLLLYEKRALQHLLRQQRLLCRAALAARAAARRQLAITLAVSLFRSREQNDAALQQAATQERAALQQAQHATQAMHTIRQQLLLNQEQLLYLARDGPRPPAASTRGGRARGAYHKQLVAEQQQLLLRWQARCHNTSPRATTPQAVAVDKPAGC